MEARISWITDQLGYIDVTPSQLGESFIYAYIISGERGTIIIETGPTSTAARIANTLKEEGLDQGLVHIIVTHIHLDHGGGAGTLAKLLPSSIVYVHPRGYRHLLDPSKLWEASRAALDWLADVYGKPEPVPEQQLVQTKNGAEIDLGSAIATIIHTPGHASHHQSVLVDLGGERVLFTGDSAGMYDPGTGVVVPTTPPPFRYDLYMESVQKQLEQQPHRLGFTHVGVASKGVTVLQKHIEQMKRWYEIALEMLREDMETNASKLLDMIASRDEDTARYLELYGERGHARLLLELSVQGLINYIREKMVQSR